MIGFCTLQLGLVKSESMEYLSVNFQLAEKRNFLNKINRTQIALWLGFSGFEQENDIANR